MAQTLGTLLTASFLAVSAALPAATAQAGTNNFILHIPKSPEDVCRDIVNSGSNDHPPAQSLPSQPIKIVTADGRTIAIDAEIADTKAEQELGLMYRTELPEGHGMLFTDVKSGKDGQIGIWMKDTYIPLDILFLDAQGRVVKTVANAGACDMDVIWSGAPAASVLELPAGSIEKMGLSAGDMVKVEASAPNASASGAPAARSRTPSAPAP